MKKVSVLIFAVFISASAVFAQSAFKPVGGKFSMELGFNPISITSGPVVNLGLKARYFLNEKWAIRLNIPMESLSTHSISYGQSPTSTEDIKQTTKDRAFEFGIIPGFEYHIGNMDRVSPYFGAELGIISRSVGGEIKNYNYDTKSSYKIKGSNIDGDDFSTFGFTVALLAGVDVYVTKGLYLGAEFGLAYGTYRSGKIVETTKVGESTTTLEDDDFIRVNEFGFNTQAMIRVGWTF